MNIQKLENVVYYLSICNIMGTFLAYFDLLGYKKFIENNTTEHLDQRTDHFARNIEKALSLDQPIVQTASGRHVYDISKSRLNCLNFSDTVVLWTKGESLDEFIELLKVAYAYNSFNVLSDFPSRGCIVYGDLWYKPYNSENPVGGRYALNMIYGKALIDAHLKAENMSWAGCVLDQSAINQAETLGNIDSLLEEFSIEHEVPYKSKEGEIKLPETALRLFKGETPIIQYYQEGIARAFTQDKKGDLTGRTEDIYNNTIAFLKRHQIAFPYYYQSKLNENLEVFGRLEYDFTHTIITRKVDPAGGIQYEKTVNNFDPNKSDRDFFDAPKVTEETFLQNLQKA